MEARNNASVYHSQNTVFFIRAGTKERTEREREKGRRQDSVNKEGQCRANLRRYGLWRKDLVGSSTDTNIVLGINTYFPQFSLLNASLYSEFKCFHSDAMCSLALITNSGRNLLDLTNSPAVTKHNTLYKPG